MFEFVALCCFLYLVLSIIWLARSRWRVADVTRVITELESQDPEVLMRDAQRDYIHAFRDHFEQDKLLELARYSASQEMRRYKGNLYNAKGRKRTYEQNVKIARWLRNALQVILALMALAKGITYLL